MQIQIDKYIFTMQMWKKQVEGLRQDPHIREGIEKEGRPDVFKVFWGDISMPSSKAIVIETGFFWQAAHLDTIGLYQRSSLCTPQSIKEIKKFNAPISAKDIILNMNVLGTDRSSKYAQGMDADCRNMNDWKGIVLALQNPYDRSIRSVTSPQEYFKFVEDACNFYGKNLFVKLHPWNSGDVGEQLREIVKKSGVRAGKTDHKVIKNCEFVLVYNSTFAVDCMIRNVPVAQYAPGYFWQNPAVKYTEYTFPTEIKTDVDFGQKTCDFLAWRYCFDHSMPAEKWIQMFEQVAKNKDMFPLPEEFSYARNKLRAG